MKQQIGQQAGSGTKAHPAFVAVATTIGGILTTSVMGLMIAPLGTWLNTAPVFGSVFQQLCRVTNAACNPATLTNNPDSALKTAFICGKDQTGTLETVAKIPEKGNVAVIRWVSTYFNKAGFDPQTRCEEVSKRFQELYDKQVLNYITTDRMNGQNVVCVAAQEKSPCIPNGLLFTLKPEEKPNEIVRQIFAIRSGERQRPLEETERIYINVKQQLDSTSVKKQRIW